MNALETATTRELAVELGRRYEAIIIVATRKHPEDPACYDTYDYYDGNPNTCVGLASGALDRARERSSEMEWETDDDYDFEEDDS